MPIRANGVAPQPNVFSVKAIFAFESFSFSFSRSGENDYENENELDRFF
jgi:hypothetical protein